MTTENVLIEFNGKSYELHVVNELWGHSDFREFEEEFENRILYADGLVSSVIEEMEELGSNVKYNIYAFDGWFVSVEA